MIDGHNDLPFKVSPPFHPFFLPSFFHPTCEEALLMASIGRHPNIVALTFVKVDGEEFLAIMDLIEGSAELAESYVNGTVWESLSTPRADWGSSPPVGEISELLSILWFQMARALAHLEQKGIIHCDVKPENALVNTQTRQFYLFDMGLARQGTVNQEGVLQIECDGCSPAYAGPEVLNLLKHFSDGMDVEKRKEIHKANPIDMACHDLWASALTIFQAVYGSRDGMWSSGDEGPIVLEKYWAAQEKKRAMGKPLQEWSHEEVMSLLGSLEWKGKKEKVFDAFTKNGVDGKIMSTMRNKSDLKQIKGLNVGNRTKVWTLWHPYTAVPINEKLYSIMTRCCDPEKSNRYQTPNALMNALEPLCSQANRTALLHPIDTSESSQQYAQANEMKILVNIANALSNHGLFESAKKNFEKVLAVEPDKGTAIMGYTISLGNLQAWDKEEQSNLLCDSGREAIVKEFHKEADAMGTANRNPVQFARVCSGLWALCHGNKVHREALGDEAGLLKKLVDGLQYAIDSDLPLVALECCGFISRLISKQEKCRIEIIEHGILTKLEPLVAKYGQSRYFMITMGSVILNTQIHDAEAKQVLVDNGTCQRMLEFWKAHHVDDEVVGYVLADKLSIFGRSHPDVVKSCGGKELVEQCMSKHSMSVPVQKRGQNFLQCLE